MATRVFSEFALGAAVLAAATPVLADAWGASWGYVDGIVTPNNPESSVVWNTDPANWLLHSEAEVHHYHPSHTSNFGADSELWDPLGDGHVSLGTIQTGDLARVLFIEAAVDLRGGPTVRLEQTENVYSYAHDIPNSQSDAAGLGQHDNLFWITWDGPGKPPPLVNVTFSLEGMWSLAGDSDPDDNWWADWFASGEVYDSQGAVLGSGSEYHRLHGPGPDSANGATGVAFTLDLEYGTPYAFRFWVDAESHAEAVPEPATALLLAIGLLALSRRR